MTPSQSPTGPERIELAPGLRIPRLVTGLWQVADIERESGPLDISQAARQLADYAQAGLDAFDMADHCGSAERSTGRFLQGWPDAAAHAFTHWRPAPDAVTPERVQAAIDDRRRCLGVDCIDLLQLDWRDYTHPAYLDAMEHLVRLRERVQIAHLGVTNFDTDHLRLLLRHGVPVATNQVSFSLLDRRAAGRLSALCLSSGVKLLARGTLAGGLLNERWLNQPDPSDTPDQGPSTYRSLINSVGGWSACQGILRAASHIATRHGVSIAAVSLRWVLEQAAVGAVVVGVRLGQCDHRARNLAAFSFALDAEDHARLQTAFDHSHDRPGDCGDEYRNPLFPATTGDLAHYPESSTPPYLARAVQGERQPSRVDSASQWEDIGSFSRAVRQGSRVLVSGTTATHGRGLVVAKGDAEAQAVYILDKIAASLQALGARMEHVVRTRVYLRDVGAWEGPARVHGRVFADIRPATSLMAVASLVGDYEIEIEAEAEIPPARRAFISSGTPYEAMAGYSRAVVEGDWAFVSGTVGVNPVTGEWASTPRDQAQRAIDTIEAALVRAGFELLDVVRVGVYLASRGDVAVVSQVIRERFGPGRPTNTTLCATMALDPCKVEIEVTAKRRVA
jgi:aryl-alcohol dehydrogenase-like predicted oxidoreductase/enamine deaminase RidA (YjgF/YER057c/UK114 family)